MPGVKSHDRAVKRLSDFRGGQILGNGPVQRHFMRCHFGKCIRPIKSGRRIIMNYILENEFLKVEFSDKGGEMQSIVGKKSGVEYLWQGNPEFWTGRAYNLFPICGRLTGGKYIYKGKEYEMNLHGFVRDSVMDAKKKSGTELVFILRSDDELKKNYPFDFVYTLRYLLDGNRIKTVYEISNEGEGPMYFAVGGHPGFNVPLGGEGSFEDYYLEFDCEKQMKLLVMTPLFFTGKTENYPLENGKILRLRHSLFEKDALFFTDMCKCVTLKSDKSEKYVRLEYPDMRNLGIWHKPNTKAPYVCIEPWSSVPSYDGKTDDLETKNQMEKLSSGENFVSGFDIEIG